MSWNHDWRAHSLAAICGAAIAAGGAPLALSFVALFAPGFFLLALEPKRGVVVSGRQAIGLGLTAGMVTNAISLYWIVELLEVFASFPTALALLVGALLWFGQALPFVVAAWMAALLLRRGGHSWLIVPACLTVAASWCPMIFPWRMGLSQLTVLPYVQIAEIGGMPLVDCLMATVGCATLVALRDRNRFAAFVAALAWLIPMAFGTVRLEQIRAARDEAPSLRVGVVQPNVGIVEKREPRLHLAQLAQLRAATQDLESHGADLVLWPESAYPFPLHRDANHDREGPLRVVGDGVRGPVLTGVITTDGRVYEAPVRDGAGHVVGRFRVGGGRRFNSAVAFGTDGDILGVADKVRLLAFSESGTPFWEEVELLQRFPRGISPGSGSQILTLPGNTRIGVLNCYEDLLPYYVRAQATGEPDFWANLTNNAWFGDTSAPLLHHMNARMRAIETRRDLVRAVNTGVSGHTAATGEDLITTGTFTPEVFLADVRLLEGQTVWVRVGDFGTRSLAAALIATALVFRRRRSTRLTRA